MSDPRSLRWVVLLSENLTKAEALFSCSREQFLDDQTLQLAGEALVMRVGDLAKQIYSHEPSLREVPVWQSAARTRDFVAHHYHRVDVELLWLTVTQSFAELGAEVDRLSSTDARTE